MLEHNSIIFFSYGVGDYQVRHILVADGKVLAFDIDSNNHLFAVTNTLEEMYEKYCHYPEFEVITSNCWGYDV